MLTIVHKLLFLYYDVTIWCCNFYIKNYVLFLLYRFALFV